MSVELPPLCESDAPATVPDAPDISVVIVSYNTRDCTIDCVNSLKRHPGGFRLQIVVVDNASPDDTVAVLRERHPDITIVASPANAGFACGNLLGFGLARGRYVLLLNPDAEVYEDTIANAVAALEEDREIGIVGAAVYLPDGRSQSSMIRFPSLRALFFNVFLPVRVARAIPWAGDSRYASRDPGQPQKVDAVAGGFMLVRRAVIDQAGGLDPRFFIYGEEVEWCHRVRRAGWQIAYRPEVRALHQGGASTSHRTVWKAREMMRGQLLYFALVHGRGRARMAAALMLARDLLRLPVAWLASLVKRDPARREAVMARLALGFRSLVSPPSGQDLPADWRSAWLRLA